MPSIIFAPCRLVVPATRRPLMPPRTAAAAGTAGGSAALPPRRDSLTRTSDEFEEKRSRLRYYFCDYN